MAKGPQYKTEDGAPLAQRLRGAVRRIPVQSNLALDLPISQQEIQIVAQALGAEITALFAKDD